MEFNEVKHFSEELLAEPNTGMLRENKTGKGTPALISPFMLKRLAKHYENGAVRHGDRNWELGGNYSNFVNAAFRHLIDFMMGKEDEDHLAAIIWNITAIIHYQELGMDEFDDMPHYLSEQKEHQITLDEAIAQIKEMAGITNATGNTNENGCCCECAPLHFISVNDANE